MSYKKFLCKDHVDVVKVGPTNLEFVDDSFYAEYECFSYKLDEIENLDMGFCIEYKTFSFDPIITYHRFEPS